MLIDSYNPQEPLFNEAIFLVYFQCVMGIFTLQGKQTESTEYVSYLTGQKVNSFTF